jgi:phenylacetyl-CoA:acceptor oxidoreductase
MTVKESAQRTTDAHDAWVPTLCWGCVEGPCAIEVHRVDGVAVNVRGNIRLPDFDQLTKNRGHACAKAFGLIQKIYNPHRIKTPLKRTNPKKGIGVDPGWVEITWDEALNTVAEKIKENRQKGIFAGYSVSASFAAAAMSAFLRTLDRVLPLMGSISVRCDMAEHSISNLIHGAFQCEPDLSHCNYLLLFGSNSSASGGVPENVQLADAYARGLKTVLIDPVLSVTGAKVDEWLPIKPGTDAAFLLAMIEVIANEMGVYDAEFLKKLTNSPYLVGPDGYFIRDASTGKVLIWDSAAGKEKIFDDNDIGDFALEGAYTVNGVSCRPAFQMLKDHVAQYTPEWASQVTDIPAETIRRIAREFVENAMIGSTITVGGLTLPHRPVATKLGRGPTGNMGSYHTILANHILACLVGSIEVVGGHQGGRAEFARVDMGVHPGADGMNKVETYPWTWPPVSYGGAETLVPLGKVYNNITPLTYLNLVDPPENFPLPEQPDLFFLFYGNPLTSIGQPQVVAEALKKIPFIVYLAYTENEMTEFADIVLPDRAEFESFGSENWLRSALGRKFYHAHLLRQPVVAPLQEIMDLTDICTELADRIGTLDAYNEFMNASYQMTGSHRLAPGKKYKIGEIMERWSKSVTGDAHDLDWFKENGAVFKTTTVEEQYDVHLKMQALKLRYPIPYFEHVKRIGEELAGQLSEKRIDWWPTEGYVPLPTYFPSVLEEVPDEYDFYVTCARSSTFSYGYNVDIPWLIELADHVRGQTRILMNEGAAKAKGIEDGDEICVESDVGRVRQKVRLCQGIRPDTLLITGQFGRWATPTAKETGWVSQTPLTPIRRSWIDPMISNMQGMNVKAKIYKVSRGNKNA